MATPKEVNLFHDNDDVDHRAVSHHHTLGKRPNQAASGEHDHFDQSPLFKFASRTSDLGPTSGTAELVILSITSTWKKNRRYLVLAQGSFDATVGTDVFDFRLYNPATLMAGGPVQAQGSGVNTGFMVMGTYLPSDNVTGAIELRMVRGVGTGTASIRAGSTFPTRLVIM